VSGQLHAPVVLPPGKEPTVPVEKGARWPHSRSGRPGEAKWNLRKKIYASTLSWWQLALKTAVCFRAAARHCVRSYKCPCIVSQFARQPSKYTSVSFGRVVYRRKWQQSLYPVDKSNVYSTDTHIRIYLTNDTDVTP